MLCRFDIFIHRYVWIAYILFNRGECRSERERESENKIRQKSALHFEVPSFGIFLWKLFTFSLLYIFKKYRVICMQNDYRHFSLPLLNLFACTHLNLNVTVTHFVLFPFSVLLTILPLISQKSEEKMIWPISFIFISEKTAQRRSAEHLFFSF